MVGLVLIAHSRALAEALMALVRQVAGKDIAMACAAGVGDQRQEFGTDATEIVQAIEAVFSPQGVVVLMDLGSAILSAETALEFLPDEKRPHIRFCAAPLVEGAIAAGVQISLGADLATVCREAQQALEPKAQHLAGSDDHRPAPEVLERTAAPSDRWQEIILTVDTPHGLHARPAARFVQTAAAFAAQIRVRKLASTQNAVPATSLNGLATLGVVQGDQIGVAARGAEAAQALDALKRLVEEHWQAFSDQIDSVPAVQDPNVRAERGLKVIPLSEGIAVGPLFHYQAPRPPLPDHRVDDPGRQWDDLQRALAKTRRAIAQRRRQMKVILGESRAAIFDAHQLILQDPALLDQARERIFKDHCHAATAWQRSIDTVADSYRALSDPYLQQRAADVIDVGHQVVWALMEPTPQVSFKFSKPVIVVAHELTPTQTAQLDMHQVLAFITVAGGPTSHSAILARARGIPAAAGVDPSLLNLPADTPLALNAIEGMLWIDPPADLRAALDRQRADWLEQRSRRQQESHQPAITRDGHRITILGNLGGIQEVDLALSNGAEGVGLLRTEFLYLTRPTPPTETEQVEALRQIAAGMAERPICVRTLDVGGDKALPYLELPPENNPFLGLRAIRLSLRHPALFHTQLRAILQAGVHSHMRVMFPMVTGREEVEQALQALQAAHAELDSANIPHCWPIKTGIMIETPSAALLTASLAPLLDFFSIGTNDLTQYTLAAERGHPHLAAYSDGLHPAVLRLIRQVVKDAHRHGKPVAICGELAADPTAVPVLLGLGLDELSLNPESIPRIKSVVRNLDLAAASALTRQILHTDNLADARRLAASFTAS
ncbi:MAG: phosphoenolpyruvate--protein phosphotransferase [Desulfobacterales bacterium]|nr:MAG: phosphoenolpyruvate--protein phosphotransferase [Desulfobacterales bacterium]